MAMTLFKKCNNSAAIDTERRILNKSTYETNQRF